MLQYNYSLVDNIIVGRYVNEYALAAVGSVGSIGSFLVGTALGLTSGFSIPVAHAFGARDRKKISHYAGNSIALALAAGCYASEYEAACILFKSFFKRFQQKIWCRICNL